MLSGTIFGSGGEVGLTVGVAVGRIGRVVGVANDARVKEILRIELRNGGTGRPCTSVFLDPKRIAVCIRDILT